VVVPTYEIFTEGLFHHLSFLSINLIISQLEERLSEMTTHQKMSPYNYVQLRFQRHTFKEHTNAMEQRQQNHKRRHLNQPPSPKIELVYSKQEGLTYIRHPEYDVGTERWVYFDATQEKMRVALVLKIRL